MSCCLLYGAVCLRRRLTADPPRPVYPQYLADANEAEAWIKEKEPIAGGQDYGKDEHSSEALLKKHEAMITDLEAFQATVESLRQQANQCSVSRAASRAVRQWRGGGGGGSSYDAETATMAAERSSQSSTV